MVGRRRSRRADRQADDGHPPDEVAPLDEILDLDEFDLDDLDSFEQDELAFAQAELVEIERDARNGEAAGFDAGQIQDVVDDDEQVIG